MAAGPYGAIQADREGFLTNSDLDAFRQIGDPVADEVYQLTKGNSFFSSHVDLLDEIRSRAETEGGPYKRFLQQVDTVPGWVDWDKIRKGQVLYITKGPVGVFPLTASSLVMSYGGRNGAQVLIETGRLKDDVIQRIFETGLFLRQIMGPDALLPGRAGHTEVLKIRMLHCGVRRYLLQRQTKRWDTAKYGVPINQEDLAGTVFVFGIVLLEGLKRLHVRVSSDEAHAYLHLWRYVGYLLGIDARLLFDSEAESFRLAQMIYDRQWRPDAESTQLVHRLFDALHYRPTYFFLPKGFWMTLCRHFLGDDKADLLRLPTPGTFDRLRLRLFIAACRAFSLCHDYVPFAKTATYLWARAVFRLLIFCGLEGRTVDYKMKKY